MVLWNLLPALLSIDIVQVLLSLLGISLITQHLFIHFIGPDKIKDYSNKWARSDG